MIIEETLKGLGYDIKSEILNTMDHGNIPQNRERIFIVGFKNKKVLNNFEFPKKVKLTKSFRDLLETDVDPNYYYTNKPLFEKIKDDIVKMNTVYQWRRKYVRENKKGGCPTLTANMGMGGHNVPIILDSKGIRKLTPKECLRLQGFPDSYRFPTLADSHLYKQAGNSVSVSVIEAVANQMITALDSIIPSYNHTLTSTATASML